MAKKKEVKVEEPKEVLLTELDKCHLEQDELLALREELVKRGITDISKLDVKLSQVNERIRQLETV